MKEIDWEERHFQICLAMLSCPVCNRHGHPDAPMLHNVVSQANKIVELLKKNSAAKMELFSTPSEPVSEVPTEANDKPKVRKSKGLWSATMLRQSRSEKVWQALEQLGYNRGDDIPYFHFNECCEELGFDVDDINVEKFAKSYDVNIG